MAAYKDEERGTWYVSVSYTHLSGIDRFLNMDTEEPQLLYIWGHSYEFDVDDNWEYMELSLIHI